MAQKTEYYDLSNFRNDLYAKLKNKIKGEVKISTKHNYLSVTIYSYNDIVYRYIYPDIITTLSLGLDSDTYTLIIYKKYKKYLENIYFM